MRIAIVRRAPRASFSMDVYADGLVSGLQQVRPNWSIVELTPSFSEFDGSALNGIAKYYRRYWALPRQLRRRTDVDLFHVVDHSDGHLLYGLSKKGKQTVITCHDLINYIQPENISAQAQVAQISTWIWQYAVRGICQADQIITVSDHTAKDVMTIFGIEPARLTTAYNGVDACFQPRPLSERLELRAQYRLSPNTFCLLNVGSNHPRKNVFAVLRALDLLRRQGNPVHFLKAGADFTPEQKTYIQHQNLTDHVTYLGKPDKEQLVQLYNAVDVLVAPSLYEGFGITPLEAMACGTPVITSNVTALPEVVGNAGIMVSPDDIPALAEAVQQLQQNPVEYQQWVDKGLNRVKPFTWNHHAEVVAQVYEKVLTQPVSA